MSRGRRRNLFRGMPSCGVPGVSNSLTANGSAKKLTVAESASNLKTREATLAYILRRGSCFRVHQGHHPYRLRGQCESARLRHQDASAVQGS